MSKISEISNNSYPPVRKTSSGVNPAESFSDVFTDALENTDELQGTSSAFADTAEDLLAKAVEESLVSGMLTSTTGGGDLALSSGYGIESLLLANAASGEIDGTQLAMFMLYMLMSTSGEDSDMSMLYGVMSALLPSVTSSSAIKTDAVGDAPGVTTPVVVGWDRSGGSFSADIYTGPVKSAVAPRAAQGGEAVLPVAYWKAATPAIVGSEDSRSAENLRAIIDQFDVENAGRYVPRDGYTFCNIFLWDVTSALGCEIPHYVDPDTGEPMTYPDVSGAMELNSNRTLGWLLSKGGEYGWREVTAEDAQNSANAGLPAVGVYENPGGIGHVQVVCPSEDGLYDESKGPAVAQAGRKTLGYAYQRSIYSESGMSKVRYFAHD